MYKINVPVPENSFFFFKRISIALSTISTCTVFFFYLPGDLGISQDSWFYPHSPIHRASYIQLSFFYVILLFIFTSAHPLHQYLHYFYHFFFLILYSFKIILVSPSLSLRLSSSFPQSLTPPLLLYATLAFLFSSPGLLHLLVLPALVEVLHHYTHKHVEDEEADNQEEWDEVEEHPWVVVGHRLRKRKTRLEKGEEKEKTWKERRKGNYRRNSLWG